jgi:hypothetical protein
MRAFVTRLLHPVDMSSRASVGFRLHTGWAMLVAIAAEADPPVVFCRCRIELLPAGRGRFVYHEAAELPLPDAGRLIDSIRHTAEETAGETIRTAIAGLKVTAACIPTGSASVPNDLAAVLRSHARIHQAEGALYAGAIASACGRLAIPLITVRERDVWARASANTGISEADLRARIDTIRKTLGPPWTADHKIATAAAMLAA